MKYKSAILFFHLIVSSPIFGQPKIVFESTAFSLRGIKQNIPTELVAHFQNTGDAPLIITNAQSSIPSVDFPSNPIQPGERSSLKISIPGSNYVGLSKYHIAVLTNSSPTPITILVNVERIQNTEKRLVTGFVRDTAGQPLPAVTVFILDSKTYTRTDMNGYYNIVAKPTDTLRCSFIGFWEKQLIADKERMDIVLITRPTIEAMYDDPLPRNRLPNQYNHKIESHELKRVDKEK